MELMIQRESIYENAAQIIVDTDDRTFEQIYNEIEDAILAQAGILGRQKNENISN